MPQFGLTLTEDKSAVQLDIAPDLLGETTVDEIVAVFNHSEFKNFRLDRELLSTLCTKEASKETTEQAKEETTEEAAASEQPAAPIIATRQDASFEVLIAEDMMTATVSLTNAYGGKKVNAREILIDANKRGINHGLDTQKITQLAAKARTAEPGAVFNEIIANGTPPKHGIDGELEKIAWTLKDRILKPEKQSDGSVDMRNLGPVISCQIDDEMMRRHPPKPGEYGYGVTGTEIPFNQGKDYKLHVGEGTKISDQDQDLLVATRPGLPRLIDFGMTVDDVLELDRVDLSTGNIEFNGSILIKDNVAEEMVVKATGDISIGGIIESATVEAQGDILIGNGIIGRKLGEDSDEHSVSVSAKKDIYAKYAQNADLICGQDIIMKEYLFNCSTQAGNSIWVGRENVADGHLMGGRAAAGRQITAGYIGAESGSSAKIDLSLMVLQMRDDVQQLETEQREQQELFIKLTDTVRQLRQMGERKKSAADKAQEMLLEQEQRAKEIDNTIETKRQERQELLEQVALVAHRKLYSLIQVKLLEQGITTKREHGPTKVGLVDGELQVEPLITI